MYKCTLCEVVLNSEDQKNSHEQGKGHQKKIAARQKAKELQLENGGETPKFCEICNVTLTSEMTAIDHFNGKTHLKKQKAHEDTEKGYLKHCELCNVSLQSPEVAEAHLSGKTHRRNQYRREPYEELSESISPSRKFDRWSFLRGTTKPNFKENRHRFKRSFSTGTLPCDVGLYSDYSRPLTNHEDCLSRFGHSQAGSLFTRHSPPLLEKNVLIERPYNSVNFSVDSSDRYSTPFPKAPGYERKHSVDNSADSNGNCNSRELYDSYTRTPMPIQQRGSSHTLTKSISRNQQIENINGFSRSVQFREQINDYPSSPMINQHRDLCNGFAPIMKTPGHPISPTFADQIVELMLQEDRSYFSMEIARNLGLRSTRDVNPVLYTLFECKVLKCLGNNPPTWCLNHDTQNTARSEGWEYMSDGSDESSSSDKKENSKTKATRVSPEHSTARKDQSSSFIICDDVFKKLPHLSELEQRIFKVLQERHDGMRPVDIARSVGLATKGDVNPILFQMYNKGIAKRINESPPLWVAVNRVGTPPVPNSNGYQSRDNSSSTSPGAIGEDRHARDKSDDSSVQVNNLPVHKNRTRPQEFTVGNGCSVDYVKCEELFEKLPHLSELERRIFHLLQDRKDGMEPLEIARAVGLATKGDVNPILFQMLNIGMAKKINESPPLWVAVNRALTPLALDSSHKKDTPGVNTTLGVIGEERRTRSKSLRIEGEKPCADFEHDVLTGLTDFAPFSNLGSQTRQFSYSFPGVIGGERGRESAEQNTDQCESKANTSKQFLGYQDGSTHHRTGAEASHSTLSPSFQSTRNVSDDSNSLGSTLHGSGYSPYCKSCKVHLNSVQQSEDHYNSPRHAFNTSKVQKAPERKHPPLRITDSEKRFPSFTETTPRKYQVELYLKAMQENSICFLPTGTGKTLVSALVISHVLRLNPTRQVVFLVDRVLLVLQQSEYLAKELKNTRLSCARLEGAVPTQAAHRPVIVGAVCGGMRKLNGVPIYKQDVLVITAASFANHLDQGLLRWEDISMIVMDEAHHCFKEHPFNIIMREYYLGAKNTDRHFPKFLGLTASPAGRTLFLKLRPN